MEIPGGQVVARDLLLELARWTSPSDNIRELIRSLGPWICTKSRHLSRNTSLTAQSKVLITRRSGLAAQADNATEQARWARMQSLAARAVPYLKG